MNALLTGKQRQDLNAAVAAYAEAQGVAGDALAALRAALGTPGPEAATAPTGEPGAAAGGAGALGGVLGGALGGVLGGALERRWAAVIRLQKEILDLRAQLAEARASGGSGGADAAGAAEPPELWLPRAPARRTLAGHRQAVNALAFHPVWSAVATACDDGTIKVWDTETGELERTIKAHTRGVRDVDFGSVGTGENGPRAVLASCSGDLSVKIWDPRREYAPVRTLLGHEHTVSAVRVLPPRDEHVASASRDGTVRIWQLDTGYCVRVVRAHADWVRALAPSADGQLLVSASNDGTARVFGALGARPQVVAAGVVAADSGAAASDSHLVFAGHEHVVECVAVAPASAYANLARLEAAAVGDGATPEPAAGAGPGAGAAAVGSGAGKPGLAEPTPSLSYFATGARDKQIIIWNARQQAIIRIAGHDNWVRGLAFHPGGRYLLSVSDDRTLRAWDLQNGAREARTVLAHDHFVSCIAWGGPRLLGTGSIDQTAKLWR